MDYFSALPDEMIVFIYEFTPESFPMLRKVNRRIRAALQDIDDDIDYCMQMAAINGYKIYLGVIDNNAVERYLSTHSLDVIMRAEYIWTPDAESKSVDFLNKMYSICMKYIRNASVHDALHARHNIDVDISDKTLLQCNIVDTLLERLMSTCETRTREIADMAITTGSAQLVIAAHNMGFLIDSKSMYLAPNVKTLDAIHKLGHPLPDDILYRLLERLYGNPVRVPHRSVYSPYMLDSHLVEYVITEGCKITDRDFHTAMCLCEKHLVELMHKHGYIIREDVISLIICDPYMLKFARGLM